MIAAAKSTSGWRTSVWPKNLIGLILAIGFTLTAGAASAETRSLKLYFIHTGEKAEIAFKRDGRFLPDGLQKLNRFLRDWRRNEPTKMDPRLFDLVWSVYRASGSDDYIHVVSAYRSPATNSMLRSRSRGVAEKSQHMLGKAMDFYLPDVKLAKLRAIGLKMEVGGVGYYPTSGSPFVHLDVGNVRHWPGISRRELASIFPDGKTIHIPSDGKPMPGYQQALAAYQSRKASGGSIQMASASSSPRRGLLAALFGGGADDEEDSAPAAAPARRVQEVRPAPQPARELPGVAVAAAEPAPQRPQAYVTALPARDVPVPGNAPRALVSVGEGAPQNIPFAVQPAPPEAIVPGAQVAANVPIPSWRPSYSPAVVTAMAEAAPAGTQAVVTAIAPEPAANDAIAALLTESKSMAGVPLPSARPAEKAYALASLPNTAPIVSMNDLRPEPAVATGSDKAARVLASAGPEDTAPRVAILPRQPSMESTGAIAPAVRTTAKSARPSAKDSRPEPKPAVVGVQQEIAKWALHNDTMERVGNATTAPAMAFNLVRTAPRTVYTAGFQQGATPDANRFSGKAVAFLSVAKFETN